MSGRPIRNKREMYPLYERGAFGNKLRTWPNVDALLADGYAGTVSLRYSGAGGGGWAAYEVALEDVRATVDGWVSEGADAALVKVNESAPDANLVVQGEVSRTPYGFVFRHCSAKVKMRDAMRLAEHAYDLEARLLLRHYLTPSSYEDVMDLLDIYGGSVVELSAYSHTLGDCRGRNAVIWEVRNY